MTSRWANRELVGTARGRRQRREFGYNFGITIELISGCGLPSSFEDRGLLARELPWLSEEWLPLWL